MAKKNQGGKRRGKVASGSAPFELFDSSLLAGTHHALAGWYAQYVHDVIEDDPELQETLRQHSLRLFELLVRGFKKKVKRPEDDG